jgi:hypothetical protein
VEMIAWVLVEPLLYLGVLMSAIVVHNEVYVPSSRSGPLDLIHKLQELDVAVACFTGANDLPI